MKRRKKVIKARVKINGKSKVVIFRSTAQKQKTMFVRLISTSIKKLGTIPYIKPKSKHIIEVEILEVKKYAESKK
ncbi:MAG: hypothetical protein J7L54_05525 [Elusimicrobia bacterium]|nr:hypothetical protein [Elusimicrobiota bacterium]